MPVPPVNSAEQAADRKGVHHDAAAEVLAVTGGAGVPRADQVLAAFDGALSGKRVRGLAGEAEARDLRRVHRKWNRKIHRMRLERLRAQPAGGDPRPDVHAERNDHDQSHQHAEDLEELLHHTGLRARIR